MSRPLNKFLKTSNILTKIKLFNQTSKDFVYNYKFNIKFGEWENELLNNNVILYKNPVKQLLIYHFIDCGDFDDYDRIMLQSFDIDKDNFLSYNSYANFNIRNGKIKCEPAKRNCIIELQIFEKEIDKLLLLMM